MALLLRMGGVPARVAVRLRARARCDRRRGEYVVRDLDAHSWVEAYFPGIGWVTFDPTPPVAPRAPAQLADPASTPRGAADLGAAAATATVAPARPGRAARGGRRRRLGRSRCSSRVALLLAGGCARRWRSARAAPAPAADLRARARRAAARAAPQRAHAAAPRRRCAGWSGRSAGRPAARGYLRALRDRRYAGRGDAARRAAQRRALRAELGAGPRGPPGRMRAWWALPPRRPPRRAVH